MSFTTNSNQGYYLNTIEDINDQGWYVILKLLKLCDDIALAREDGDLALEEELASELLEIYRSPEFLIEVTKDDDDD